MQYQIDVNYSGVHFYKKLEGISKHQAFHMKQISEDKEPGCLFLRSLWKEWIEENSDDSGNQCHSEFMPV